MTILGYPLSCVNPLTRRYPRDPQSLEPSLGHTHKSDIHLREDLAIFHPSSSHSYLLNRLSCGISYSVPEGILYIRRGLKCGLDGMTVVKEGNATLVTMGQVQSPDNYHFLVVGCENSWFCSQGDSGSLVLLYQPDKEGVGIPIGIITSCSPTGTALCTWIHHVDNIPSLSDDENQEIC